MIQRVILSIGIFFGCVSNLLAYPDWVEWANHQEKRYAIVSSGTLKIAKPNSPRVKRILPALRLRNLHPDLKDISPVSIRKAIQQIYNNKSLYMSGYDSGKKFEKDCELDSKRNGGNNLTLELKSPIVIEFEGIVSENTIGGESSPNPKEVGSLVLETEIAVLTDDFSIKTSGGLVKISIGNMRTAGWCHQGILSRERLFSGSRFSFSPEWQFWIDNTNSSNMRILDPAQSVPQRRVWVRALIVANYFGCSRLKEIRPLHLDILVIEAMAFDVVPEEQRE